MDTDRKVVCEALTPRDAGTLAITIEVAPVKLTSLMTKFLRIPTISIGGQPSCSGQLLVTHKILGMWDIFDSKLQRIAPISFNRSKSSFFAS